MRFLTMTAMAAIALAASTTAWSQGGPAFTATGQSCDQVTWSADSLAKYPKIASACQAVLQKDGVYYVKFSGEVKRVQNRGADLTVAFKDGAKLVLHPKEDQTISINGKETKPSGLRPGDQLNFYVPQSRLVAEVSEQPETNPAQEASITPAEEPVAMAPAAAELPKTASSLPMFGLIGLALLALGAALTAFRLARRSS